jgi:hypothetical protein
MRIWVIDAFTDRPFARQPRRRLPARHPHPARECVDAAVGRQAAAGDRLRPAAARRRRRRLGTALVHPTAKSNLCGHATLATAHSLRSNSGSRGTVRFASRFGVLVAHSHHDGPITLDFPAAFPTQALAPDGLAAALGAMPPGHLPHR